MMGRNAEFSGGSGTPMTAEAAPGMPWPREVQHRESEGRVGDPSHITKTTRGYLPTSLFAHMEGARGEAPGEHRNRQGEAWERFKGDIAENGIRNPLFVTVDYGERPKLAEGNHRRDAAVDLGHTHVPVEIRYFGHAERHTSL